MRSKCPNGYRASLSKKLRKEDGWCTKRRSYIRLSEFEKRSRARSAAAKRSRSRSTSSSSSSSSGSSSSSSSRSASRSASRNAAGDKKVKMIMGKQIYVESEGQHRLYYIEKNGKRSYRKGGWSETLKRAYDNSLRSKSAK